MFIAFGLTGAAGIWAFIALLRQLYYICQPSEVLIFAGLRRTTGTGKRVGYRTVRGGSALRIPVLEEVMRLDLSNKIIDLQVTNAYSKGGVPLNVSGVANIKISGEEPGIHNAIERLIGKSQEEVCHIAKETLEGNLRGPQNTGLQLNRQSGLRCLESMECCLRTQTTLPFYLQRAQNKRKREAGKNFTR